MEGLDMFNEKMIHQTSNRAPLPKEFALKYGFKPGFKRGPLLPEDEPRNIKPHDLVYEQATRLLQAARRIPKNEAQEQTLHLKIGSNPISNPDARIMLEQALVLFQDALKRYEDNLYIYGNLGYTHFLLGNYELCIENYKAAIAVIPSHPLCQFYYNDMGTASYELGRIQDALRYYGLAIELAGDDSSFPSKNRALLHLELEQYPEALQDISRAIQMETIRKGHFSRTYEKIREAILSAMSKDE